MVDVGVSWTVKYACVGSYLVHRNTVFSIGYCILICDYNGVIKQGFMNIYAPLVLCEISLST